jgi:hypothetical protein
MITRNYRFELGKDLINFYTLEVKENKSLRLDVSINGPGLNIKKTSGWLDSPVFIEGAFKSWDNYHYVMLDIPYLMFEYKFITEIEQVHFIELNRVKYEVLSLTGLGRIWSSEFNEVNGMNKQMDRELCILPPGSPEYNYTSGIKFAKLIRINLAYIISKQSNCTIIKYNNDIIEQIGNEVFNSEDWIYYDIDHCQIYCEKYWYSHDIGRVTLKCNTGCEMYYGHYGFYNDIEEFVQEIHLESRFYSCYDKMVTNNVMQQLHDIYYPLILKQLLNANILFKQLCNIVTSYCI